jgi:hypothetical protein
MAIAEVGNATSKASSTTPTITHGLTILAGHVIIVCLHCDGVSPTSDPADNNGATPFTLAYQAGTPDTSRYSIWYRVAGSGEPATYKWTKTSASGWSIALRVFSGVDATVWDVTPGADTGATGTSASPSAPSVTITTDGSLGIAAFFVDSSSLTFSSPTNDYGSEVEPVAGGRNEACYTKPALAPGATGATGVTMSGSDDWAAQQFALKPDGSTFIPTRSGGAGIGSGIATAIL